MITDVSNNCRIQNFKRDDVISINKSCCSYLYTFLCEIFTSKIDDS